MDPKADNTNAGVWLERFHRGERGVLEKCYLDWFGKVEAAAGQVLSEADAETVTHEVFYRMISDSQFRTRFRGGNVGAWLARVAHNAAIDLWRHRRREGCMLEAREECTDPRQLEDEFEAKMLIGRFKQERLPEKWHGVFEVRFIQQLPQRAAASALGMERSTLVYQEQRVRELLTDFLVESEVP